MIHYSWVSVGEEPGFLLPFKSNLSIQYSEDLASSNPLSSSLLNFDLCLSKPLRVCFQITPVVYSVRWDQQTRWPLDYHVLHIQMDCLKFPMAKPVQVLHTASGSPRCSKFWFSHTIFPRLFYIHLEDTDLSTPWWPRFFLMFFFSFVLWSLSGLQKPNMSCRPFPSAAQPVCKQPQ